MNKVKCILLKGLNCKKIDQDTFVTPNTLWGEDLFV